MIEILKEFSEDFFLGNSGGISIGIPEMCAWITRIISGWITRGIPETVFGETVGAVSVGVPGRISRGFPDDFFMGF